MRETMASVCPACGGEMLFDPSIGKLKCSYCGSLYDPSELDALWRERAEKSGSDTQQARSQLTAEDDMAAYNCAACGAELMADKNTAVMLCPYCGNHAIAPTQFAGSLRPDYIIPFAHTKEEAEKEYLKYYERRLLIPRGFKQDQHVEEIQGVYVPFWLYSGRAEVTGHYIAHDVKKDRKGNTRVTARFDVKREGHLDFKNVPADASRRMDDALMDSVEPYDMNGLTAFSLTYLPAFLAERYDVGEDECRERAHTRVETTSKRLTEETVKHDKIAKADVKVSVENEQVSYALFPVWMLTSRWKDKSYKFAMNGQTGDMIGDLPVSAPKLFVSMVILFFVFFVVGLLIALYEEIEGGGAIGVSIVFALILDAVIGYFMYKSMKPVAKKTTISDDMSEGLKLTIQNERKISHAEEKELIREVF